MCLSKDLSNYGCRKLKTTRGVHNSFQYTINKAVLLSYASALDPYNPIVYSFTIEMLTASTILKIYCHYLRSMWFTPLVPLKHFQNFFILLTFGEHMNFSENLREQYILVK